MKLYQFPHSTNVERVQLALAHKGLKAEPVWVNPKDRSELKRVSGQPLVPVLEDYGRIVFDSTEIIRYLDTQYLEKPLYPFDPSERARMEIFIDWFNRVWKRPPNDITTELQKPSPDLTKVKKWGEWMTSALDLFDSMLVGWDYFFGYFSAADCIAFPFLKYALLGAPKGDSDLFHKVLVDWMPLGSTHPRLMDWIRRVDTHPRA